MTIRGLLRVMLASLLVCAVSPVLAQPAPVAVTNRALMLAGDFPRLERLYAEEFASGVRALDGELPSVGYFYALEIGRVPANWSQDDQATRAWLEHTPASVPALIARSFALARRAHVLDQAGDWAGVETALREQERLLMAVQPKATKDIVWHTLYVGFGRHQGWPPARIRSAVEAGLGVDPTSVTFYLTAGRALAPERRGSAEPLEWLAREGAARTVRTHPAATYATIRLWTADIIEVVYSQPFGAGLMDWEMMNLGMMELYRRNPNYYTLNEHAALACRAGDKNATAALITLVGRGLDAATWKRWGGVSLYENCRKWVGFGV